MLSARAQACYTFTSGHVAMKGKACRGALLLAVFAVITLACLPVLATADAATAAGVYVLLDKSILRCLCTPTR